MAIIITSLSLLRGSVWDWFVMIKSRLCLLVIYVCGSAEAGESDYGHGVSRHDDGVVVSVRLFICVLWVIKRK